MPCVVAAYYIEHSVSIMMIKLAPLLQFLCAFKSNNEPGKELLYTVYMDFLGSPNSVIPATLL